jgi:hypothetical protein
VFIMADVQEPHHGRHERDIRGPTLVRAGAGRSSQG